MLRHLVLLTITTALLLCAPSAAAAEDFGLDDLARRLVVDVKLHTGRVTYHECVN